MGYNNVGLSPRPELRCCVQKPQTEHLVRMVIWEPQRRLGGHASEANKSRAPGKLRVRLGKAQGWCALQAGRTF